MLRKLNLTIALLSILAFTNSAFASVYQTVDLSTGINVGAIGFCRESDVAGIRRAGHGVGRLLPAERASVYGSFS